MKKTNLSGLILCIALTGCVYGKSSPSYVLTANNMPDKYDINTNELVDHGYRYSYTMVYGVDGNFVFHFNGSFESTNGIPDNKMTITHNANFLIFGLTYIGEEEVIGNCTSMYDSDNQLVGYAYNLTGYTNFKILNTLDSSEEDNILGTITFWS